MVTNPSQSQVINGIHLSDYVSVFGNHHFGCTVEFSIEHSNLSTRRLVLEGRNDGIHVWRRSNEIHNVYIHLSTRIKTSCGVQSLTNLLYGEEYHDKVQALCILDCNTRATITGSNQHVKEYE